nr:hypothetical protein Iba_chr04fCG14860 [Ipomoea batatas]
MKWAWGWSPKRRSSVARANESSGLDLDWEYRRTMNQTAAIYYVLRQDNSHQSFADKDERFCEQPRLRRCSLQSSQHDSSTASSLAKQGRRSSASPTTHQTLVEPPAASLRLVVALNFKFYALVADLHKSTLFKITPLAVADGRASRSQQARSQRLQHPRSQQDDLQKSIHAASRLPSPRDKLHAAKRLATSDSKTHATNKMTCRNQSRSGSKIPWSFEQAPTSLTCKFNAAALCVTCEAATATSTLPNHSSIATSPSRWFPSTTPPPTPNPTVADLNHRSRTGTTHRLCDPIRRSETKTLINGFGRLKGRFCPQNNGE